MKRIVTLLLCIVLLAASGISASAEGMYASVVAEIPVGGTGSFCLKRAGAEDSDIVAEASIRGSGRLTLRVDKPGSYSYELFSPDVHNSARYDVTVIIMAKNSSALEAFVVIREKGREEKLPFASYPVNVVPSIKKWVIGSSPLKTETFFFTFRAVSTTVPELQGNMPMPTGSTGQSRKLSIVGTGAVEIGEIFLPREGRYVYECTELAGNTEGYTYDNSALQIVYDVTEGPGKLEISTTYYKDGVEITESGAGFVNTYVKPGVSKVPKTGDNSNPLLWVTLMGLTLAAMITLVGISAHKRRSDKTGDEDAQGDDWPAGKPGKDRER